MSAINKINVDNVSYNIEDSRVDNIADSIPTASTEQKGLVQVGQGINVDENGVISVEASGGDSVSYTDMSAGMDTATIGTLNINGTDYNINAPTTSYINNLVTSNYTSLGFIHGGVGATSEYEVTAPGVRYDDYAQGDPIGLLTVGDDQYPITCSAASGDSVQFNSLLASGTQIGTITINGVETAIYAPAGGSGGGSSVSYRDNTSPEDQHRVVIGELTIDGAGYYIYAPSTISVEWDNVLNKPTIPTATSQLTNDSDFITAGIARDIVANQISNTSIYDLQGAPVVIGDISGLTVTPDLSSGTKVATISWFDSNSGENTQDIYAPAGGSGGGDTVTVTPTVYSGTKIADINVSGNTTNLYAPNSVTSMNITSDLSYGTKIATIAWTDSTTNNSMDIYAPAGGSGGSVDWADVQNKPAIEPGTRGSGVYQQATNAIQQSGNTANGDYSIAIGYDTQATNHCAVAVGGSTQASGMWSVATGDGTIASSDRQVAMGKYNSEDGNNYFAVMVGNGSYVDSVTPPNRENAEATAWNGNKYIAGDLYVNCTDWDTTTTGGQAKLVTADAGGTRVATMNDIAGLGGDTVTVTQTVTSGTKIADIDVSGTTTELYAPAQTQTDWTVTSSTVDPAYIKNKPFIGSGNGTHALKLNDGFTLLAQSNEASGNYSTAAGTSTRARGACQFVIGSSNVPNAHKMAFIIGNGAGAKESNAAAVDKTGNLYLSSDVYVGCTDYTETTLGAFTTTNCGGHKLLKADDLTITSNSNHVAMTEGRTSAIVGTITKGNDVRNLYLPEIGWRESVDSGGGNTWRVLINDAPDVLKDARNSQQNAVTINNLRNNAANGDYSLAEGSYTTANNTASHAEGYYTSAMGAYSHAEGANTIASFEAAHAEGYGAQATGQGAHAEGGYTEARAQQSHAEGNTTKATGQFSHAEGVGGTAGGTCSHAEGWGTLTGNYQHAQGQFNVADINDIFADIVGNGTDDNARSNAEATDWNGNKYLAGNVYVGCTDYTTTADGLQTTNCGGTKLLTSADVAVSSVLSTGTHIANITVDGTTTAIYAPQGGGTQVNANWNETDQSSAAYIQNKPSIKAGTGIGAVILSNGSSASMAYAVAEGCDTRANGQWSHAEGYNTITGNDTPNRNVGVAAHAEGNGTKASGKASHAEGYSTSVASISDYGHAEGWTTSVEGDAAHAEGRATHASSDYQHVQGFNNIGDSYKVFADIIGNGNLNTQSNAEATDWNGNKYLSGGIYVGCTDYTTTANGLTRLGAGGFRIDMATGYEDNVQNPTEPDETISEDLVMVDTITKVMGYEEQEDPDNPGETIQVPTTVTTTHQRRWEFFPNEYTARDLAADIGNLDGMNPNDGPFDAGGIYTLQIWSVKHYIDDGEGNMIAVYTPEYRWVKTAETTPEDAEEPTPEEPTE